MKSEVLGSKTAVEKKISLSAQKGLHSPLRALYSGCEASEQDEAIRRVLGFFQSYLRAGHSSNPEPPDDLD